MNRLLKSVISKHSLFNANTFGVINNDKNRLFSVTSVANARNTKNPHPSKIRTLVVPVETSIKYLRSAAYKETYGDEPVWKQYRRNYKGHNLPRKTRKMCIRVGVVSTGNPCPICRDEYLIVDHRNVDLLKQFLSPTNGELLSFNVTGVCQKQHEKLDVEIMRAKDQGLMIFDLPFYEYDYSEFYSPEQLKDKN